LLLPHLFPSFSLFSTVYFTTVPGTGLPDDQTLKSFGGFFSLIFFWEPSGRQSLYWFQGILPLLTRIAKGTTIGKDQPKQCLDLSTLACHDINDKEMGARSIYRPI
jgi:hypothetical protein